MPDWRCAAHVLTSIAVDRVLSSHAHCPARSTRYVREWPTGVHVCGGAPHMMSTSRDQNASQKSTPVKNCGTGVTSGKRAKPIFFARNLCKMGQLKVFRVDFVRFGHFGVPSGPPRGSEKSSKSSSKFWREDVGYLIIRPDILILRDQLFHVLESAQPRFITHFRRSKRRSQIPYSLASRRIKTEGERGICDLIFDLLK